MTPLSSDPWPRPSGCLEHWSTQAAHKAHPMFSLSFSLWLLQRRRCTFPVKVSYSSVEAFTVECFPWIKLNIPLRVSFSQWAITIRNSPAKSPAETCRYAAACSRKSLYRRVRGRLGSESQYRKVIINYLGHILYHKGRRSTFKMMDVCKFWSVSAGRGTSRQEVLLQNSSTALARRECENYQVRWVAAATGQKTEASVKTPPCLNAIS